MENLKYLNENELKSISGDGLLYDIGKSIGRWIDSLNRSDEGCSPEPDYFYGYDSWVYIK